MSDYVEGMLGGELVYNALRTPDGTVLESRHRHDYQTHTDANGKEYMIDGGLSYVRCSANGDEVMLTLTVNSNHNEVREKVQWGTYGKDGDQPLSYVRVLHMSDNHLRAVLDNVPTMHKGLRLVMENELLYRQIYSPVKPRDVGAPH